MMSEKLIIPHLSKCKRSAALMPEWLAYKTHANLRRKGKHAYLGRGTIENYQSGFELFHLIPLKFLKRVNGLAASGIRDWWTRLNVISMERNAAKTIFSNEANTDPESKSYVIFFVLLFGHSVALRVFLVGKCSQLSGTKALLRKKLFAKLKTSPMETAVISVKTFVKAPGEIEVEM